MDWKNMLRTADVLKLVENWKEQQPLKGTSKERDFVPVAKLFNPAGTGTWLVTEANEDGLAFGLSDLGYPELGYFDLNELAEIRLFGGHVRIEQDLHFEADKPLSKYAEEARFHGCIKA